MKFSSKLGAVALVAMMACASAATASVVTVDARLNSVVGGSPLNSHVHLEADQTFTVDVNPAAIWNFGGGNPAYDVDANGGGMTYSVTNPDGSQFVGAIGALIGQIGTGTADAGNFFMIGTNFSGAADVGGDLNMFFWDTDAYNNTGVVSASINAVPEPASLGLMAFGLLALARRRRS